MKSRSHGSMPGHVVGRQAVDEQGAHAELVQAPGGAAELVALGAAPVLAEDAAHAVAAAAEARPHRDPGGHERLDGGQGQLVADEGDGLQQDEVGRMVLEGARQQLDELAPGRAVDVAVDREGERDLVLAPGLLDRLAPDLDAEARDVHPVQRREVPGALGLHLGGEAPRVGRDDVAALLDVAAVHVAHDVGVVDQRPRAPQRLVAAALGVGQPAPELGGDATVEDHAALGLQQLLDAAIRRRQLAARRPDPTRPAARSCRPFSIRPEARVASQGVGMPLPEGEGAERTSGARLRRPLLIQRRRAGRLRHPSSSDAGEAQIVRRRLGPVGRRSSCAGCS